MDEDHVPIVNKDFISEEFDNEIILYTLSDTKAVYLSETARLVWQLCEDQQSVGEMIGQLEEAYPEHAAVIREDVREALSRLAEIGALSFSDDK